MTLRSRSRGQQWVVWLCLVPFVLVAYVVISRLTLESVSWNLGDPRRYRVFMLLLIGAIYLGWEMRWDGVKHVHARPHDEKAVSGAGATAELGTAAEVVEVPAEAAKVALARVAAAADIATPGTKAQVVDADDGAALFARARALMHHEIPDCHEDSRYLILLVRSATRGYGPAQEKLGEYAMRRAAWVEAYFWMTQARINGIRRARAALQEIRMSWEQDGCPDEEENINRLFTAESGSIGRALLYLDTGRDAAVAKRFLMENCGELWKRLRVEG